MAVAGEEERALCVVLATAAAEAAHARRVAGAVAVGRALRALAGEAAQHGRAAAVEVVLAVDTRHADRVFADAAALAQVLVQVAVGLHAVLAARIQLVAQQRVLRPEVRAAVVLFDALDAVALVHDVRHLAVAGRAHLTDAAHAPFTVVARDAALAAAALARSFGRSGHLRAAASAVEALHARCTVAAAAAALSRAAERDDRRGRRGAGVRRGDHGTS